MAYLTFPQVADRLVAAIQVRLAATTAGQAGRAGLIAGRPEEAAWDDCDCDGLLLVATGRIYGSDSFPAERGRGPGTAGSIAGGASRFPEWASMLVAELGVQLVRCAAIPQGDDVSVPAATLQAEGEAWHVDAYEVLVAVVCELEAMRRATQIDDYEVRDQPALGPQGGCVGSQLNLAVAVPFLCPCPGLT